MPSKSSNKQKKEIYFLILLCSALLVLSLSAFNLSLLSKDDTENVLAKTTEFNEIHYWEGFLSGEPEYLPGWIRLVVLSLESADYEVSFRAFSKIHEIDPNIDLSDYSFFSSD